MNNNAELCEDGRRFFPIWLIKWLQHKLRVSSAGLRDSQKMRWRGLKDISTKLTVWKE